MEAKQDISKEQNRADGNRAVPRRSFSDYGQWLDVFWDAVKLMGGNPHMSQAFTEVAWRDDRQPEDAAAEYCGLY